MKDWAHGNFGKLLSGALVKERDPEYIRQHIIALT